jgi:hypothetical protein
MNSRRPQGEGPNGLPGCVWTDEPPEPTTFTLMLFVKFRYPLDERVPVPP